MVGRTISHYEILEKLGEGGMGAVYRARDTRLGRMVAVKTLPAEALAKTDRKLRFIQEARTASALNHPNIVTIYDIDSSEGTDFIAMEYVPGKTLGAWIGRKGLKIGEVLKLSVQIADAVAAAHAAGIIHRDLKPGNIMVTENGVAKVLDFGLAKLGEHASADGDAVETQSMQDQPKTEEGMIVGTAAYMSPEQAAGKKVDARSDIFSFGAVLYEMVSGWQAFHGDTKLSTLAAILNQEPAQLSAEIPRDLERVVNRCLRKDPQRRFQHMDDVKIALEELKEESDSGKLATAVPTAGRRKKYRLWAAALGVFVLAAAGLWLWQTRARAPAAAFEVVPLTTFPGNQSEPSFSPDGNQVAFVWDGPRQDNFDIYVKQIGTESLLRLTSDPAEEAGPAWSPDGRYIAFLRFSPGAKTGVFLVSAIGGPERKLAETWLPYYDLHLPDWDYDLFVHRLGWSPDGKWLAMTDASSADEPLSLFLLSIESGEKRRLTFPPARGLGDGAPAFSPDGRRLVFVRAGVMLSDLYLLTLASDLTPIGEPKRLTFRSQWTASPAWTPDGREILFSSGLQPGSASLWRTPASGSGTPAPLQLAGDHPAISRQGTRLAYRRSSVRDNIWRVELHGPDGRAGPPAALITSTRADYVPQYSPDGKRIAFMSGRSGRDEVWVSAADGSNAMQLTSLRAPVVGGDSHWSPDGQSIVFDSNAEGHFEVYVISASGGKPQRMTNHPSNNALPCYSRDGRWIYFLSGRTGRGEIWKMPAAGGEPIQVTREGGNAMMESPDGRFLYYVKSCCATGLWKLPVTGGDEKKALESVRWMNFTVVQRGIYFIPEQPADVSSSIQFLDFAKGTVRTITRIEKPLGLGLSVSPDERYILYTQREQAGSDLMLVENFR